jgi:WD40 repeat protein
MSLKSIQIKELVKDQLFESPYLYNLYIVYKSIDIIDYLVYAKKIDIIMFNLSLDVKQITIKNAHNCPIANFNHYGDTKNKRDLILSLSCFDMNIKLWNANTFECLYNFTNIFQNAHLYSVCFLNNKDNIYIITSDFHVRRLKSSGIHVYDLNGKFISIINKSSGDWRAVCSI